MSEMNTRPTIDPQLEAMLAKLRETPERDSQAVAAYRAKFETQLDAYIQSGYSAPQPVRGFWTNPTQKIKENYQMMKNKYRFAFMFTAVLLVLAAVLFGGAGATVSAAKAALPGDALYPVKTSLEQAQARLAANTYDQALLYLKFAELKLGEAAVLIDEGRYEDISTAVTEFDFNVQKAAAALEVLSSQDPGQAAQLSSQISDALSRFALVLTDMLAKVPDPVATEMQRALQLSGASTSESEQDEIEIIGEIEAILKDALVINGQTIKITALTEIKGVLVVGGQVKVHAIVESDGSLTAREIEPALDEIDDTIDDNENDDGNTNDDNDNDDNDNDDNDNDDGNSNDNDNDDDDDDDGNSNDNDDNDDDDDDGNSNDNDNDDDDDDDGNSTNDNDDDDDDDSNSNDDDDDDYGNSNDDDGDDRDANGNEDDHEDDSASVNWLTIFMAMVTNNMMM